VYMITKDYKAGRRYWDGNVWREDRDKAKLYETPEVAYAVRRKLGLLKTSILSTAGAELATMAVSVCVGACASIARRPGAALATARTSY
jgi:hypothetical protein